MSRKFFFQALAIVTVNAAIIGTALVLAAFYSH